MNELSSSVDVAISGAGPVGMALAALLVKRGMPAARILLLDARPLEQARADPRSIALSWGSSRILAEIGAWPIVANPIGEIHVSRRGHFGRTLIEASEYGLPALGYVTRYGVLADALAAACTQARVQSVRPARIVDVAETADGAGVIDAAGTAGTVGTPEMTGMVRLSLDTGQTVDAGILVQAEGGLFNQQASRAQARDYRQTAIVAQVGVGAPLMHRAFERFTTEGPLALLPQSLEPGAATPLHYALVWCMRPETAEALMALSDAAFLAALEQAFGGRVGRFLHVSARSSFTLGLNANASATGRTVAIGNAAQTLHPVAGQGLNLGLRDATVLARLLAQDAAPAMLPRFLRERQADRSMTIRLTDAMARVFASAPDGALSQALLGLSLGAVDAVPPARRWLAEQMMFGQR